MKKDDSPSSIKITLQTGNKCPSRSKHQQYTMPKANPLHDMTDRIYKRSQIINSQKTQQRKLQIIPVKKLFSELNLEQKMQNLQKQVSKLSSICTTFQTVVIQIREQYRGAFKSLLQQVNPKLSSIQQFITTIRDDHTSIQIQLLQLSKYHKQQLDDLSANLNDDIISHFEHLADNLEHLVNQSALNSKRQIQYIKNHIKERFQWFSQRIAQCEIGGKQFQELEYRMNEEGQLIDKYGNVLVDCNNEPIKVPQSKVGLWFSPN